jgi:UDP-N-acetylglucosamine--N-acetylmuramyl-(pentapeptide) pyrophosphoryl-undecaprenol N-acetylglucosamine transferase
MPINPEIIYGNKGRAIDSMPSDFREDLPTILFSSGSSLFKKMAKAPTMVHGKIEANILVVGELLEEKYKDYLKNVIYLGYVNNLPDLYQLADVVVLSDDGLMIHEALACQLPTIALTYVKWGRYHNMAGIFPNAVLESDLDDLSLNIEQIFNNKDEIRKKIGDYSTKILETPNKIGDIVLQKLRVKTFKS